MEFELARAGPFASLVLDGEWTAGNIGPPGQEPMGHRSRSGPGESPVKADSTKQHPAILLTRNYWLPRQNLKNRRFATASS
jgi:hypothetical protein